VEEAFIKNKHRGDVDDIKIATQPLVSKDIVNSMFETALSSPSEVAVSNSLMYLLTVVQRMNADELADPYKYDDQSEPENKYTMNFESECIFEHFDQLVGIVPLINR
jgi:hypothetical protein